MVICLIILTWKDFGLAKKQGIRYTMGDLNDIIERLKKEHT